MQIVQRLMGDLLFHARAEDGILARGNQPAITARIAPGQPEIDGILRRMQCNAIASGKHFLQRGQPNQTRHG
ncbi:MAG: hypothetical protein M5R42_08860 [Rhodocyclaceae bacterium]|nr:hypothetical protein [Rhodocyclaceae bacterium]